MFEFYANGKLYKVTSPKGWMPSRYQIGDKVKLNYDPKDPSVYRLAEKGGRQYLPQFLEAAGVLMLTVGVVLFINFALSRS